MEPAFGRKVRCALVIGALVGATSLASAPAAVQAGPSRADVATSDVATSDVVRVVVMPGTRTAAGSAARDASPDGGATTLSSCATTVYGYTGYRICEFEWFYVTHSNGSNEYFVIGTNYAVFHIWPGSGGWKSLGGKARKATPNGAYFVTDTGYYGVRTIGTDNWSWCRFNLHGSWSSWDTC
ncbi:hypothetical protein AAH979_26795 [Plantactinospora sp. ZYX-F-223]|uniref:hypothetical protein n=1 Tax=Plantactinospora sp. ZYX-F-223 TaxID=3144103 RepID=UPI0031FBAE5C